MTTTKKILWFWGNPEPQGGKTMFMFNYGYSDSPAIIIALSIVLAIGVIGLDCIIYEFFIKSP